MNTTEQLQSLQALIDWAKAEQDDAARALAQISRQREDAQDRLSMLVKYHDEYLDQRNVLVQRDAWRPADQLNMHRFLGELESAIAQQRSLVTELHRSFHERHSLWSSAVQKSSRFEVLLERARQGQRVFADRLEQKQADEWASRKTAVTVNPGGLA